MEISVRFFVFLLLYRNTILEKRSLLYQWETHMKFSSGVKSMILFMLSFVFLLLLTLFETSLAGLSVAWERMISLLLLVLPGVIGVVYGVMGVMRKEPKAWVAHIGIVFNVLFVLFHLFILSFAG